MHISLMYLQSMNMYLYLTDQTWEHFNQTICHQILHLACLLMLSCNMQKSFFQISNKQDRIALQLTRILIYYLFRINRYKIMM